MFKFWVLVSWCTVFLWGADFFPLQTGNTWTYREPATGETFTIRVGTPVMHGDAVFFSLNGYTPQRLLVRVDERGNLVYLDGDDHEVGLTSFTPFEFGWWQAPARLCDTLGQTLEKRGSHAGPAGGFRDVLEVRYQVIGCADAGEISEQYAENIGLVRRVVSSFAGPRTFDLVSARIGRQVIEGLPNGRCTLSLDDAPRAETLLVNLRIETYPSGPLLLRFPTGQEYEIVLRDPDGVIVYRWSDGQAFDQAFHDRTISGEWSIQVHVPRPAAGAYTVEAWLTTEGVPRFSATAPFTVEPAGPAG